MTAGTLFTALLLAHLVGDWLLQTDRQAAKKTASWPAMVGHVVHYHIVMLAVLALVWPAGASQLPALGIVVVSAVRGARAGGGAAAVTRRRVATRAARPPGSR